MVFGQVHALFSILYSVKFLTLRQSIALSKILTNRVFSLVKGCCSIQTYQQLTCLTLTIHNHRLNSRFNCFTLPYLIGYELSVLDTDPRLAPTVFVAGTPRNVGEKCARACCYVLSPPLLRLRTNTQRHQGWSFGMLTRSHQAILGEETTEKKIEQHMNSSTTQASTRGIAANNDTAMQRG